MIIKPIVDKINFLENRESRSKNARLLSFVLFIISAVAMVVLSCLRIEHIHWFCGAIFFIPLIPQIIMHSLNRHSAPSLSLASPVDVPDATIPSPSSAERSLVQTQISLMESSSKTALPRPFSKKYSYAEEQLYEVELLALLDRKYKNFTFYLSQKSAVVTAESESIVLSWCESLIHSETIEFCLKTATLGHVLAYAQDKSKSRMRHAYVSIRSWQKVQLIPTLENLDVLLIDLMKAAGWTKGESLSTTLWVDGFPYV